MLLAKISAQVGFNDAIPLNLFCFVYFFGLTFGNGLSRSSCRIHESLDYLEGRATVFHSRYLCAWASTGATPSVALGHFVLPPAAVQEGRGEIEENTLKNEDLALLGGYPVSGAFWGAQTRPCR